jgi:hypothetical protein
MTGETWEPGDDDTVISIRLPLPMPVYGTMMKLVGAAYPDALLGDARYGDGLNFIIPKGVTAKRVSKAAAKAIEPEEGTDDVDVLSAGPEDIGLSLSRKIADDYVVAARETFKENPAGTNYVEHLVIDRENHRRYVLIFAQSPKQTPHELRMAAERELGEARQRHAELEAELAEYRGPGLVQRIAQASAKHEYEKAKVAADTAWEDLDEVVRSSRIVAARRSAVAIAAALDSTYRDDIG